MTIDEAKAARTAAWLELKRLGAEEAAELAAHRAKWDPPINAARSALFQADHQYDLAVAEAAKSEHASKVGKRYVEWRNRVIPYKYATPKAIPWERTGRVGIMEVFGPNDKARNAYSRPRIGGLCIRPLLKSGKPSTEALTYDGFSYGCAATWFPEGVHPTEAKQPERKEIEL